MMARHSLSVSLARFAASVEHRIFAAAWSLPRPWKITAVCRLSQPLSTFETPSEPAPMGNAAPPLNPLVQGLVLKTSGE